MTTTVMKDSQVGDTWIQEMCRLNPVQRVLDDKTGQPNGLILTGPVRLAFPELFKAVKAMKSDANSKLKFMCTPLFPPYSDMTIFWEIYYAICASDFASYYNPGAGQYYGLENPLYDQGMKANKYAGFTPGLYATNVSSDYKPPVVDVRGNPIVDESKVYAGVWAILALNSYASGKNFPKKGPRFGLSNVMIVGDDKPLGGGAFDSKVAFKGVNVRPPAAAPGQAFAQGGIAPPPGGGGASMTTYYPPGGHGAPPAHPMPSFPPPPMGAADEDLSQFT